MKRFCILFATVLFAACGIQDPGSPTDHTVDINVDVNVNDDPVEDSVEDPTYLPAPFRLAAVEQDGVEGWRFEVSRHYISDAPCGEARGSWPGVMGWGTDEGVVLTEGDDGYLHFDLFGDDLVDGSVVVLSYIQGESCGDNQNGWAQYGSIDQLLSMAPEALEWIYCGWVDGGDGSDTCNIRLHVTADAIVPAGNMQDFQL